MFAMTQRLTRVLTVDDRSFRKVSTDLDCRAVYQTSAALIRINTADAQNEFYQNWNWSDNRLVWKGRGADKKF